MVIELPADLVGTRHSVTCRVAPGQLVCEALPGVEVFASKPAVLATGWLVVMCEWPAMEVLGRRIDRSLCSLGTRVELSHCAPVPVGAWLTISTRCRRVAGCRSSWSVEAHDEHELIGAGRVDFAVVETAAFVAARLAHKTGAQTPVLHAPIRHDPIPRAPAAS